MNDKTRPSDDEPVVRRAKPLVEEEVMPKASTTKPKATPRKKVTAEDMEAKFSVLRADRELRKATRQPREMGKLVRIVVASALGIGTIAFALGIGNAGERHTVEVKANESKVAALTGALEELTPTNGKDATQKLAEGIAAAQKRSGELAAAQQRFASIAYAANMEPGTNDGRPKPAVLKSLEHRKELVEFFAPDSLILTDAEAYTFRTEDLLGPGKIDPRQPWFTRHEATGEKGTAQKIADPKSYVWKTASVTPSGTPDVLTVVWSNTDVKTGELLAWATARYSAESNTFRNLSVNKTTQGDSQSLKVDTAKVSTSEGSKA